MNCLSILSLLLQALAVLRQKIMDWVKRYVSPLELKRWASNDPRINVLAFDAVA